MRRRPRFSNSSAHGEDVMPWPRAGARLDVGTIEDRLRLSEARILALTASGSELIWVSVAGGRRSWSNRQWAEYTDQRETSSRGAGWLDVVHPDDRSVALLPWAVEQRKTLVETEYRIRHRSGRYHRFQVTVTPVVDEDSGDAIEWIGRCTDVEAIRRAEDKERAIDQEIQQRLRGVISTFRSTIRYTAATSKSVEESGWRLEGILDSFARVQLVAGGKSRSGVNLEFLVADELFLGSGVAQDQTQIAGPEIWVHREAAEILAEAVHELATSSLEFGALSTSEGSLSISWSMTENYPRNLEFSWVEVGEDRAPEVARERRRSVHGRLAVRLGSEQTAAVQPGSMGVEVRIIVPSELIVEYNDGNSAR